MINKVDMLKTYIENNVSPILIEDVNIDTIGNIVRINADCEKTMLMGHYEETKYLPPVWFDEVVENSKKYKNSKFCRLFCELCTYSTCRVTNNKNAKAKWLMRCLLSMSGVNIYI